MNYPIIQTLFKEQNLKKTILSIAEYINNGENLKIKPIDSNLKDKCRTYCHDLRDTSD